MCQQLLATRGRGAIINISSIVAINTEVLNGVYSGTKSYVLALTQSMQHKLADKGLRVQAVLPGPTVTEFWRIAGSDHSNLPADWLMRADDMVDAALVGFDKGEVVTIPSLQDGEEWVRYDAARGQMSQRLANSKPGSRYLAR